MQEKIYLSVKDHETGEHYVTACTLPAQIGRQHDVNNQVLLGWQYKRVSRIHGMIERTPRSFVFTDSSANGSRVGGLVVRDSRVSLSPMFHLEIENYTLSRVEADPFTVLSTDDRLIERQRLDVLPGRGIGVTDTGHGMDMLDMNRWTEQERPVIGRFEVVDGNHYWVAVGAAGVKVTRNKAAITQERTPLVSLDVIEVDGTRFELLHPHEQRIVCGYDHCHLLNPPPLEANCRHCGRHLANAGGFSRVL